MSLNVAIVEDNREECLTLQDFLKKFSMEEGIPINSEVYDDALVYLDASTGKEDVVFLDINLPSINGMDAAERLRKKNSQISIVFVTSLLQYAIDGYKVEAIGYLIKPVNYQLLVTYLKRVLRKKEQRDGADIVLDCVDGMHRVRVDDIDYVEVVAHKTVIHANGKTFDRWASLKDIEAKLPDYFVRCNVCYLVNLKNVQKVSGSDVWVGGDIVRCSRPQRKAFLEKLTKFFIDEG